jgi:hypothetical protein
MATGMRLKLKTVFVLYFMVSLMGLVYALMQLGEPTSRKTTPPTLHPNYIQYVVLIHRVLQVSAVTAQSTTCPRIVPSPGCGGSCTALRSR